MSTRNAPGLACMHLLMLVQGCLSQESCSSEDKVGEIFKVSLYVSSSMAYFFATRPINIPDHAAWSQKDLQHFGSVKKKHDPCIGGSVLHRASLFT